MQITQFKDRVNSLLAKGNRELSTTLGVVARIQNNNYEVYAVESNSGAYVPGEKYALGDTFSREVFENQLPVTKNRSDISTQTIHHPLYRSLPLECYIGAPIVVNGTPWGCVDFSSMVQRDGPFGEQDVDLVKALAVELSELIDSIETSASRPPKANNSAP